MSITITIEGQDAKHARQEMLALLGEPVQAVFWSRTEEPSARTVAKEDVTAGEVVDALHSALKAETTAEDADGVEFPAAAAEPPKRRGRPRKEAPVVDADTTVTEGTGDVRDEIDPAAVAAIQERADEVLKGDVLEPVTGQIDIEDVIAEQDNAPQPEDPAVGWTIQDARNAGRALLDRAPDVDTGNRKLAATLVPFGVQQVKALQPDQIEAFVVATQKAVF